jgi:hypothetical protein
MAAHSDTVTNVAVRCSECHQGRPLTRGSKGTETLGPAAEIPIMIRVDARMATAASQAVRRVSPGEPGRSPGDAPVPPFSLTESPVRWS